MAQYTCGVCGYTYDEAADLPFSELATSWTCPVCSAAKQHFTCTTLAEDPGYARTRVIDEIHYMAATGKSITELMETLMPVPSFDEIFLLGAQLARPPLDDDAFVNGQTMIGKHAKQPMVLETPVFVSHMSFGALPWEAKIALAKGSATEKMAMCSGEGGGIPVHL